MENNRKFIESISEMMAKTLLENDKVKLENLKLQFEIMNLGFDLIEKFNYFENQKLENERKAKEMEQKFHCWIL